MQTDTYHARLRAQQAEWRLLKGDERSERATRAAARSARRWADSDDQSDQQRRAGRLELIHSVSELDDASSPEGPDHGPGESSPLTGTAGPRIAPALASSLKLSSTPEQDCDIGSQGPVHEQTQLPLDAG